MAELITIDKDVPIPETKVQAAQKYPWKTLAVGDSFLIEKVNGEHIRLTRERANSVTQYARAKTGLKFCTRTQADGIRVWRIE